MRSRKHRQTRRQTGGGKFTTTTSFPLNGYDCSAGQHDGYKSPTEDRYTVLPIGEDSLFVGVFDGHTGSQVVDYINTNLPPRIIAAIEASGSREESVIHTILKGEFLKIDLETRVFPQSGCTAAVAIVTPDQIFGANLGDSPLVYFTEGGAPLFHSIDHDANNLAERARVESVGGEFLYGQGAWRLAYPGTKYPGLMVTRAFGDILYKQYKPEGAEAKDVAIAEPQLYTVNIDKTQTTYLAVCCDSFTEKVHEGRIQQVVPPTEIMETFANVFRFTSKKDSIYNLQSCIYFLIENQTKSLKFGSDFHGDNTTLVAVKFPGPVSAEAEAEAEAVGAGAAEEEKGGGRRYSKRKIVSKKKKFTKKAKNMQSKRRTRA